MKLNLNLFVVSVVLAVGVVACGGEAPCEACPEVVEGGEVGDVQQVHGTACPVDDYNCNPDPGPEDPDPVLITRTLKLQIWNASPETRVCQLTYRYPNADGTDTSITRLAAGSLSADERRLFTESIPYNKSVTITAACWHPGYPEVDIRAGATLTTLPMDQNRECMQAYSETYGPQMQMPCW